MAMFPYYKACFLNKYRFAIPTIVCPADCEVQAVVRFLSVKGVKAINIHREIVEVEL